VLPEGFMAAISSSHHRMASQALHLFVERIPVM
jgi:hypothetical protein